MNDTLDNELREIETQLAMLSPNKMPDDILKRMEQAMIAWEDHLPVEEKIVPFNSAEMSITQATDAPSPRKINLNLWGAAAAIVLATGLATVFSSNVPQDQTVVAQQPNASAIPDTKIANTADSITDNSIPELSRNITHASNEGITYAGKDEAPFKVLRIEYTEKVVTLDKDGKPVVTKKPCVEHVLVPVPLH